MKQLFHTSPVPFLVCNVLAGAAVGLAFQALINRRDNRPAFSFERYRSLWCFAAGTMLSHYWLALLIYDVMPGAWRPLISAFQTTAFAYMVHGALRIRREPANPDSYRPRWLAFLVVWAVFFALARPFRY